MTTESHEHTSLNTNERVARIEEREAYRDRNILEMKSKVDEMHDVFTQAKGIKAVMIVVWIALGGFIFNIKSLVLGALALAGLKQ